MQRRWVVQGIGVSSLMVLMGSWSLAGCGDDGPDRLGGGPWAQIAREVRRGEPALNANRARRELGAALADRVVRQPPSSWSAEERAALDRRIADDFAEGRTMLVAGWLLSRSEALVAVLADGQP